MHKCVSITLNNNETYTGILVPNKIEKNGFFILYEKDDNERVRYFKERQLVEMWIFENKKMKLVYRTKEKE